MTDRELVALMAAIIYASPKWPRSQNPINSVHAAMELLATVEFPRKKEKEASDAE